MHLTDLCEEEIDDACLARIDVTIRQGEGGLPLPEQGRIMRLIGHSPVAYVAGTDEEIKRLPEKPAASPKIAQGWPNYGDLYYVAPRAAKTIDRSPSIIISATRASPSLRSAATSTARPRKWGWAENSPPTGSCKISATRTNAGWFSAITFPHPFRLVPRYAFVLSPACGRGNSYPKIK